MVETDALTVELEESLRHIMAAMTKYGRALLNELDISTPQFNALITLKEFGSLTMGELCKHMFTACSTATDLADRMEQAGLVARVRDNRDRRVIRIHLLPKGEAIVDAVVAHRRRFLAEAIKGYSEEKRIDLLHTINQLRREIENVVLSEPRLNQAMDNAGSAGTDRISV